MREWQVYQLGRTDRTIAELEQQEAAAARTARTLPPPELEACIATGRRPAHPDAVHTSDCGMAGKRTRPMSRDQALRAITEDGIPPCPYCRPDTDLGVL